MTPSILERIIHRFVQEVKSSRSGYWVGVKLSSVLTEIRDYYHFLYNYNEEEYIKQVKLVFQAFLNHDEILRVFAEKYYLKNEVLQLVSSDPRFRDLKPYKDLIAKAFKHAATLYPVQIQQSSTSTSIQYVSSATQRNPDNQAEYFLQDHTPIIEKTMKDESIPTTMRERYAPIQRFVKLREEWRGTRGGTYYYVMDGNVLRRISDYAISKRKVYESRRGPTIEYDIPVERLYGKLIYMFSFSNKGYLYIGKFTVEALLNPKDPKYPYVPNYEMVQNVSLNELAKLSFEAKDKVLYSLLNDFEKYYVSMINDLNNYSKNMDFNIIFMGHAERTRSFYYNPYKGIIECMVLQSDAARLKCLEKPMAWIHQLWVMKLLCEALEVEEFMKKPYEDKPSWRIEQGKPYPAFIAKSRSNYYTFWFEFQPHKMAHLAGMFFRERVHVRPDIVVTKGSYNNIDELIKHGKHIDLIIECKNTDFKYWENDLYNQIPAYIHAFKPKTLILASLKRIPDNAKQFLASNNIIALDELQPNNNTKIKEFKKLIKQLLL